MPDVDPAPLNLGQKEVKFFFELVDWLKDPIWRQTGPDRVTPDPRLAFLTAINKFNWDSKVDFHCRWDYISNDHQNHVRLNSKNWKELY